MATDLLLLDRLRTEMQQRNIDYIEKKMFGGHCFMVDGKMCFGTFQDGLMARVGPQAMEELMSREGASQMINGSRPMKGYMKVESGGYDLDSDLSFWIDKCLAFNPEAKASKK
ncbi:RNA methyltransferase [bacterium]|nr:RNA methyltransferase [bacterium]